MEIALCSFIGLLTVELCSLGRNNIFACRSLNIVNVDIYLGFIIVMMIFLLFIEALVTTFKYSIDKRTII